MKLYNIIINLCNVFMCHNDDISLVKIIINNDNKSEIKDNENIVSQNTTKDLSEDEIKEHFHKQYPSFEGNDFFLKFYKYNKKQGVGFLKRFDFYFLFLNLGYSFFYFFKQYEDKESYNIDRRLYEDKETYNIERILQTIMRILRIIIMFLLIYSFVFIRKKKLNKKNFIFMKFCTTLIPTIHIVLIILEIYEMFLPQSDYDNVNDSIIQNYFYYVWYSLEKRDKRYFLRRIIFNLILLFQQAYGFDIIENTPLNKNGNFSFSLLIFFDARCISLIISVCGLSNFNKNKRQNHLLFSYLLLFFSKK
jgi:hypothetical protein